MKAPENEIVTLAMERHRLPLPALAEELGVAVSDLGKKALSGRLTNTLGQLYNNPPAPLDALADLPLEEQEQMGEGLLADVTRLANQRLALEKELACMRELWEVNAIALNKLRRHMKGLEVVLRYFHIKPGEWKKVRPLEIAFETAVKANNGRSRQSKSLQLAQVKAGLQYIQDTLLPEYEIEYETYSEVHDVFDTLAQNLQDLEASLADYRRKREQLQAEAPIVLAPTGQDLSIRQQQPNEATAQALAEAAVSAAKAKLRTQERDEERELRQKGKAREAELIEETFDTVLVKVQAGEAPGRPYIAPEALDPTLLKGKPTELLGKAVKPGKGLVLPKAPKIKNPVAGQGKPSVATQSVIKATATSPGTPTETAITSAATHQPQAGQSIGSHTHAPTPAPSLEAQAAAAP